MIIVVNILVCKEGRSVVIGQGIYKWIQYVYISLLSSIIDCFFREILFLFFLGISDVFGKEYYYFIFKKQKKIKFLF